MHSHKIISLYVLSTERFYDRYSQHLPSQRPDFKCKKVGSYLQRIGFELIHSKKGG